MDIVCASPGAHQCCSVEGIRRSFWGGSRVWFAKLWIQPSIWSRCGRSDGDAGQGLCWCPGDAIYNNVGNCVFGWDSGGILVFLWETKNARIHGSGRRTRGTTRHSPAVYGQQAHSLPTTLSCPKGEQRGERSAHSITGVPGFSYVLDGFRAFCGIRAAWKHHFGKAAPGPLPRTLRKPYTDRLLSARNGSVYSVPSTRCGYRNRRYR